MQRNEDGAAGGATNDQQQQLKCSIDANSGTDFQINLNEFLEFLKLSCHVNDMIAKADMGKSHTREPIPPMEGAGGGGNQAKRQTKREEFDFDTLAENHLVNELLGLKRLKHHRHSTATTTTTTTNTTSSSSTTTTTNTNTTSITATTSSSRDESRTSLLMAGNETKSLRSGPGHVHGGGGRGRNDSLATYRGLHPKLSEQLDAVINEGVLDSVLSFICPVPVPVPLATTARNKPKQQQQQQQQHMPPAAKEILTLPTNPAPAIGAAKSMTDMSSYSNSTLPVTTSAPALQQQVTEMDGIASSSVSNNLMRAMVKEPSTSKGSLNTTGRRKSLLLVKDSKHLRQEKREPEVVIHVCDEVKNTSRDFTCPQSLLVSKMGYFADVTAGQRLEEMDISVHCDILIFDWLMKWIKHSAQSQELPNPSQTSNHASSGPQLDGNNVVPILVSASFLQMEPLLLECLTFCHAHLSEVVRTSTNLSCLNDALVTRLAAMFTNLELEIVRDKKERVTPRLWTKLIQSLSEPEPEALRGHFYSMSGLFRCIRCFSCVTNTMKSYMNCTPSNIRLNRWGQLMSGHVRDPNWDLNIYIMQLFKELKSWRKVYWKLWGHCHYLYCCTCEAHFPVYQMNWCRYHPEAPNFLGPVGNAGPAGRYACCGQQAFRYETLPGPNGCQFREHSVLVETDRERAILAIAQLVAENFALCELPPLRIQELAAAGEINPSWQGISLTPQRCRQGLLPQLCMDMTNHRVSRRMRGSRYQIDTSTDSETTSTSEEDARSLRPRMRNAMNHNDDDDSSESSDGCESEHHHRPPPRKPRGKKGRKRPTEVSGRFWSGELSARSNQDHQRDFEEKIMKQVATYVTKKTGSDQSLVQNAKPLGGTYVRLETEWKEMLKQRHSNHNLPNNSTGLAGGGGGPGGAAGGGIGPGGGNSGSILSSSSNTLMSGSIPLGGMGGCGGPTLGSSAPLMSKQKHK